MSEDAPQGTLLPAEGHFVKGLFRPFVHLCPGYSCAIWAWLKAKAER